MSTQAQPGATRTPAGEPVVEMRDISITFPGVKALDGVGLRLFPGEVHAVMGENGAGKSTLIKALTGVYGIDSGTIAVNGQQVSFTGPAQAQESGIATVYQEVNLVTNLSVAENILLGREPRRLGMIDFRRMRARAREVLRSLNLDIDPGSQLGAHSIAVQQLVAIARAVDIRAQVLILDEPTSSLDMREVAELFTVIRRVRDEGVAVLFVSHFLDQVYEISDRITVLRNGKLVGEYPVAALPRLQLVSKMIGKDLAALDALEEGTRREAGERVEGGAFLAAAGLGRTGSIQPYDLEVHPGEVVGLAGLLGSGRTELVRLLYGADRSDSGSVAIKGERVRLRSPREALDRGIAFASENRKAEGLIGDLSVRANIVLALQAARGWVRQIPRRQQDEIADKYIKALDIRPGNPDHLVRNLSGGNQQKVLLARWLLTRPKLLILDEPTRGIDVGAKAQIQKLVASLSDDGMAVIFISAELEEVLRLSHRIGILRDRRMVDEILNEGTTVNDIMGIIADDGSAAVTSSAPLPAGPSAGAGAEVRS
ncbi:ATP-binding cassette domain-containing protein [Nakamurella sp. YIM 132087]|uniref:ATP-binding cassette domain-containing protein n=1 Tax=Nakamurella alba TaxID=2665158 RepID=A0A7K1FL99_9ACTN|nr:sugar ABC transporter ATP-binding protein [Nakamurella alba]MTD14003.1 ATP-binding cassette domain-containing protein [Nakamurella alba]